MHIKLYDLDACLTPNNIPCGGIPENQIHYTIYWFPLRKESFRYQTFFLY